LICMESYYELDNILSTMEKDEYFADFLNTKNIDAGIIRLRKDQKDTQTSHPLDELYYIIKGDGNIIVDGKARRVRSGSVIFVPSNLSHHFCGNKEELIVLYVFSKHK
jgi:mannose-6-phosphate isomerase-like protein (cupin superfamily)